MPVINISDDVLNFINGLLEELKNKKILAIMDGNDDAKAIDRCTKRLVLLEVPANNEIVNTVTKTQNDSTKENDITKHNH
ncbi:34621_t:CDS:2 [Gigaspora margarita]|uniref:34621_t:CDS:1 n=1 Tax=Gigaspora margarita TaxID=4874 RepID=A0ABM8VWA4_GIGMA|nr:34621_t:CDS:2 [Gigaspora margarita]